MPAIIDSVLRAGEGRTLRKLKTLVSQVNSIEDDFRPLSDAELRAMTVEFRQRYADGETLDDLLPEAFATAREAATRVLGQRHFDVQLMGGAARTRRKCAASRRRGRTFSAPALPVSVRTASGWYWAVSWASRRRRSSRSCCQFRRPDEQARPALRGRAGEVQAEAEQTRCSSHTGAQYGEGWLKMTVRLVILPSRIAK
jgi:SecA DEAD-like domain